MQMPHKRRTLAFGSIPHEVTDYRAAKIVKSILEEKATGSKQENAHINDQNTTWFGISWEDVEFPLFRDYGRYADVMAESKARMSGYGPNLQQDHRTLSLVSFDLSARHLPRCNHHFREPLGSTFVALGMHNEALQLHFQTV